MGENEKKQLQEIMKNCLEARGYEVTEGNLDELFRIYEDCQEWDEDTMMTGRSSEEVEDFVENSLCVCEVFNIPVCTWKYNAYIDRLSSQSVFDNIINSLHNEKLYWLDTHHDEKVANAKAISYEHSIEIVQSAAADFLKKKEKGYGLEFELNQLCESIMQNLDARIKEIDKYAKGRDYDIKNNCHHRALGVEDAKEVVFYTKENYSYGWIPFTADNVPDEGQVVDITFRNSAGTHVGEATYKKAKFFYVTDTVFGYYEEQYENVLAWRPRPKPYRPD